MKAREARSAEAAASQAQARREAATAVVSTGKSAAEAQRTAALSRERVEVLERVRSARCLLPLCVPLCPGLLVGHRWRACSFPAHTPPPRRLPQSLADAKATVEAAERQRGTAAKRARAAEAARAEAEKRALRWQGKAEEAERAARAERDRADGLEHRLQAVQQRARALVGGSPIKEFALGPAAAAPASGHGGLGQQSPRARLPRADADEQGAAEGPTDSGGDSPVRAEASREEGGGVETHVLERLLEGSRKEARALQADRARLRRKVERLEGQLRVATGESQR